MCTPAGTARAQACAAAAAWPRAARAVPSCAGAYVSGADGSNECPAGSVRIEAEAACRTAAASAGKPFAAVGTYATYPRGCYIWTTNNKAYFNPHAVGAGEASSQLLCALATTTGAPPRAPRGSTGPAGVWRVWDGTMYRVLTGYSRGTLRGSRAAQQSVVCSARSRLRTCRAA
jgi:hypothetical protein